MRRDYRGRELECFNEIVDGDIADVIQSDIVLVNASRPSWGTGMELFFASQIGAAGFMGWYSHDDSKGRFVLTVCPDKKPSPWLIRHSKVIVKNFEEAFAYLLNA